MKHLIYPILLSTLSLCASSAHAEDAANAYRFEVGCTLSHSTVDAKYGDLNWSEAGTFNSTNIEMDKVEAANKSNEVEVGKNLNLKDDDGKLAKAGKAAFEGLKVTVMTYNDTGLRATITDTVTKKELFSAVSTPKIYPKDEDSRGHAKYTLLRNEIEAEFAHPRSGQTLQVKCTGL